MEKTSKKELWEIVDKQRQKLTKYENRLRDIVPAYESLIKEKEALEESLKAFILKTKADVDKNDKPSDLKTGTEPVPNSKKEASPPETVEQLKTQLSALMNSLATLSAEKSKMEANFQSDKKQLRTEREEYEKVIRELREKLKQAQKEIRSEVEHVKYKLIMERHEREKEQADHSAMIKYIYLTCMKIAFDHCWELQRLLNDERCAKEQLENQVRDLKINVASKEQSKLLEAELEIARNKLKQAEAAAKETPPLLLSLQSEMASLKQQHRNAIQEEQKRASAAEQQARILAMTHESRVAGLEARLAELSETVGGYDRLRHQDQQAIQKLKDQLANLQGAGCKDEETGRFENDPEEIAAKIKKLYARMSDLANQDKSSDIKNLLGKLNLRDVNEDLEYKEKFEKLEQEFEDFKLKTSAQLRHAIPDSSLNKERDKITASESNESGNYKLQLNAAKLQVKNLEERLRRSHADIINKEKECKSQLENQQQLLREERLKSERSLSLKENEFRGKISTLEHQLQRQRERTLVLIQEKDQEIQTLKSSFHALLPKKASSGDQEDRSKSPTPDNISEPAVDLVTGLLTADSPPMLHYAQELARREVQVSGLRKSNMKMEADIREKHREYIKATERHREELKRLENEVTRLKAYKSREGANLEYLKNVVLNYLLTNDASSKRHMLNAISTILHFTPEEVEKIRHLKRH
ncbi:GRIP and coiled-coil domain-containing protein 1 isoform X1 [Neodiprion fabricii]|uniref:GRIP and coiled-coil domain-containing protein 1 isoform X1 n=1 Tax=Neodiprion fabricii TaxID=2872261 RepID=UPI001ED94A9D|nr:GRIP and coiled-coil domain-containing protein 1 isoform X1 [Neodiprion fabricii]